MRCWTVQQRGFLDQPGDELVCGRRQESAAWQSAYGWMREAYERHLARTMPGAPVWLWDESRGPVGVRDRHASALSLVSWAEGLHGMVCLDVELPEGLGLRSSYLMWNLLVDFCMLFGAPPGPEAVADWDGMFRDTPVQQGDDIQVVVPALRRDWILAVSPFDAALLTELEGA